MYKNGNFAQNKFLKNLQNLNTCNCNMVTNNSLILVKRGWYSGYQTVEFMPLIFTIPWHLTLFCKLAEKWPEIKR
jgi:hypothetical protein